MSSSYNDDGNYCC